MKSFMKSCKEPCFYAPTHFSTVNNALMGCCEKQLPTAAFHSNVVDFHRVAKVSKPLYSKTEVQQSIFRSVNDYSLG